MTTTTPVWLYLVFNMSYVPKFFSMREFARVGCSYTNCPDRALIMLDSLRSFYGRPVILKSAFRTIEQNQRVGGVANSAHLRGLAFDLACSVSDRYNMLHAAMLAGFERIGIGDGFIHVDCDESLPHPRVWTY